MVLRELKHGMKFAADTALKKAPMSKAAVKKHLSYLKKAGRVSAREFESLVSDIVAVSQAHHKKMRSMVAKEVRSEMSKMKAAAKKKASGVKGKAKSVAKRATSRAKKVVKRKVAKKKKVVKKKAATKKRKATKRKTTKRKSSARRAKK